MGDPAGMRVDYRLGVLDERASPKDPLELFQAWFADAKEVGIMEPNAMTLATVDADGMPAARTVLMKGLDLDGFTFFSNYESRKAGELAANANAALLFYWDRLERQVRIEGTVKKSTANEADAYFASRPYGSQIGAWASPQSRVVENRAELEGLERACRGRFPEGQPVPRPAHWGGYRLRPRLFEFWQGRPSRLHDRLRYTADGGRWRIERLAA